MPVLFLLNGQKWVFRPAGATLRTIIPNFTVLAFKKMWTYSRTNREKSQFLVQICPYGKIVGRRQGNEPTTFWKQSGRHPDLNPD